MNITIGKEGRVYIVKDSGAVCAQCFTEEGAEVTLESLGISSEEANIALGLLDSTHSVVQFDVNKRAVIDSSYGELFE